MKKTKSGRSGQGKSKPEQEKAIAPAEMPAANPLRPRPAMFKALVVAFVVWVAWLIYLYVTTVWHHQAAGK